MKFRWNEWNVDHIAQHGIRPAECEFVVEINPYRKIGDDKFRAIGKTPNEEYIQVIFIFDPAPVAYVIHARRLTDNEKRRHRR